MSLAMFLAMSAICSIRCIIKCYALQIHLVSQTGCKDKGEIFTDQTSTKLFL